jgi:hypothetical protein
MKRKILLLLLCILLAGGGCFAYLVYQALYNTTPNAYAVWWVADMVIEHMEANDGHWPTGWDDLVDDYGTCAKTAGRPWTFEELRGRVEVDWHADPNTLVKASNNEHAPPFRVIWLKDGSKGHWAGREPNRMILQYLLNKRKSNQVVPIGH